MSNEAGDAVEAGAGAGAGAGTGAGAGAGADAEAPDGPGRVLGVPAHTLLVVGTIVGGLLAWEAAARFAFGNLEIIFPTLGEIGTAFLGLATSGEFHGHVWVSTQEVLISFALAAVLGIVGGTVLGASEFLADAVEPIIYYFSTIPKIVLYPLFIVALGAASMDSKIAMGFFSAIFPVTVNTITGALSVREDLLKVARVYQANAVETFAKVYVPSMLTHIVNGLRLGIGVAIIGVLLGELFASQAGVGNQIKFFFSNLQTPKMYAALLIVFVGSLGANLTLLKLQDFLRKRGYGAASDAGSFGF